MKWAFNPISEVITLVSLLHQYNTHAGLDFADVLRSWMITVAIFLPLVTRRVPACHEFL